MIKIELLAPAGNRDAVVGAINAGANAIYMAGKKFGARAYASNFDNDEMIDIINFVHLRGAKVFITINTLVFDDEINELLEYTDFLVSNHVDALIIQDLGVLSLLSNRYPNMELHASTQMNTLNIDQVKVLKSLGVKRVILARETSIEIIKEIKENIDIEIEVFVHGALCVSYSGNCLFSSMIGGRSGNRGECAQPCRLPYELLKDDQLVEDQAYLMSTKDLMTIEHLNQLIEAGVDSLKIEGRMRKAEYVIQTVMSYRKAISHFLTRSMIDFEEEIVKLKKVFNRGYTDGYLFDIKPKTINNPYRPNHMGIEVGEVIGFHNGKVEIELSNIVQVGDGIRFIGKKDFGLGISRILKNGLTIKRAFASEIIEIDSPEVIEIGSKVLLTMDSNLEDNLSLYLNENYNLIHLVGRIRAMTNEILTVEVSDDNKNLWVVNSDYQIIPANNKPVDENSIREQFSKLGNTPFCWKQLVIETDNKGFIPVKIMNDLRRSIIDKITNTLLYRKPQVIVDTAISEINIVTEPNKKLIAYVRTIEQYEASKSLNIEEIYVDEDLIRRNPTYNFENYYLKKRRIWRNTDNNVDNNNIVVSDIGHFHNSSFFQNIFADEFMNVTNIYSAEILYKLGAKRVTLSPEMTKSKLESFINNFFLKFNSSPNLEKIVYGHEELMISKYCPIAKTFDTNPGCDLCYKNQYYLKDRMGAQYPLVNDGFCNIKVLHSKPLNLIDYVSYLYDLGINTLRMNFTTEDYQTTYNIISNYQKAINKETYYISRDNVTTGRFLR
ncbi:MAG: hypothetical protein CVV56_03285 [Tenericutes bacterium HGW-Tenericutes-1]|jgi:putative protease|nr:MAG: hypothetical protein CVV56_03285 [Tenericutes bacterium HGW-Tenericutes-1]